MFSWICKYILEILKILSSLEGHRWRLSILGKESLPASLRRKDKTGKLMMDFDSQKWKMKKITSTSTRDFDIVLPFLCVHWNTTVLNNSISQIDQVKIRSSLLIITWFFLINFHLTGYLADDLPHMCFHFCMNLLYSNHRTNVLILSHSWAGFALWKKQYYNQKCGWIYVLGR